jgi:hypothetical protein
MKYHPRAAFTVMEVVVSLACLLMAATLVAQVAAWSLSERFQADTRLGTMEWAANVLENARAKPWAELTPAWAAEQKLPEQLAERMLQPVVTVSVEPEPGRPRLKRVSVAVRWQISEGAKAPPVELMTLFADPAKREGP